MLDEEVEEELKKMADQYQMELEKVKAAVSTDSVRVLSATENIDTFNENDDLIIGFKGLVNDSLA